MREAEVGVRRKLPDEWVATGYTGHVELDPETCFDARSSRDHRFDGRFFVGMRTTGVYCRPVCPARAPRRDRCTFFRSAAEAEREGYRACFRCRPELAPGAAPVDAQTRLVTTAAARIDSGALNDSSVDELAALLGVTGRLLHRAMVSELGISPQDLAQSRRMALARQLVMDTSLPLAEAATAAGFRSLRRFNAAFEERFGRPPTLVREGDPARISHSHITLRLDYRPPYDFEAMLATLRARVTAGVEVVEGGTWRRSVSVGGRTGFLSVTRDPTRSALTAEVSLSLAGALQPLVARLRALFDLDARPDAVAAHLGEDPLLRPSLRKRPGLRVLGSLDGFETAVRVVLGQQVSVAAATTVAGRLARALGQPVSTPFAAIDRLSPTPDALASASEDTLARLGMPGARARTLIALGREVRSGELSFAKWEDPEGLREKLLALPGVGPWTADMIAMRALGAPDAFPAGDLGVLRALGVKSVQQAEARAEAWRPWRAYAAIHLWATMTDRTRRAAQDKLAEGTR